MDTISRVKDLLSGYYDYLFNYNMSDIISQFSILILVNLSSSFIRFFHFDLIIGGRAGKYSLCFLQVFLKIMLKFLLRN